MAPRIGFRGFTLSLIVSQPATVNDLPHRHRLNAGATSLMRAAKSLWGYGAVVQARTGWTVASSSITEVVYLVGSRLGVDAEVRFLGDLAAGEFTVEPVAAGDWLRIAELVSQY